MNKNLNRREFLKLIAFNALWLISPKIIRNIFQELGNNTFLSDNLNCIYRKPTEKGKKFLEEHLITSGDSSLPYIAITYDDQPFNGNTEPLQSLLDTYTWNKAKATFFFRMEGLVNNSKMQDIVKRLIDEGHELGFHGWRNDHPNYLKISPHEVRQDLERCLNLMHQINQEYCPRFIRWPYGLTGRLLGLSAEYGLQVVNWNLESGGLDPETKNRVLRANKGSIVLSHMIRYYDVQQAPEIIKGLRDKNLYLGTVSQILNSEDSIPLTNDYFNISVCSIPAPNMCKKDNPY